MHAHARRGDARATTDAWGRALVAGPHSAWSCNDRTCPVHPASLYGVEEAPVRVSIADVSQPAGIDLSRLSGRVLA